MPHRWRGLGLILFASLYAPAQVIPGRYIVELSTPPVAQASAATLSRSGSKLALRSAAANTHRARIRAEQASVRSDLAAQPGVQVLDSTDTVMNALIVKADDAAALANLPGVTHVYPVRRVKLLLDRAVLLHRVADVWNQIGSDHAGRGIKVGIIDTGIDNNHPGLKNSSLTAPAGFPLTTTPADTAFTNGKVIVARSYVDLLPKHDTDTSARDRVGHGTALAMIVAGVRTVAPLATITGVAPEAWLGSYKVFGTPGINDNASDDAIVKAMDDAVADGMDVISLSVGSDVAPRLADDAEVAAVERATAAGVIVVVAAGNNGPDLSTVGSPASAPSAISVGATSNDRTFGTSLDVPGLGTTIAVNGSGTAPSGPLTGRVIDVGTLDGGSGEGCSPYRTGALAGTIALIRRGNCTFEVKLQNAQQAGAVAALVSARADAPDPFTMGVGAATLPSQMISYDAGEALRAALTASPGTTLSMQFSLRSLPLVPNRLVDFSSTGPNVDLAIKPDIAATGSNFYTATQTFDRNGDMYSSNGFIMVGGTSFSTPLVAGMAALIKAARPGLTVDQYRSLLINTAAAITDRNGNLLGAQRAGAGLADASAALHAAGAVAPVSLGFGSGPGDASFDRKFTLTNLGTAEETWSVTVEPNGCASAPSVAQDTVTTSPGSSVDIGVTWNPAGLPAGACEGIFRITGTSSGTTLRLPWWYAVPSGVPAAITQLDISDGRRGATVSDAVLFRISDGAGLPMGDFTPQVTVTAGGGEVVRIVRYDSDVPGMFGVDLRLGPTPGTNTIEVRAGDVVQHFDITAR